MLQEFDNLDHRDRIEALKAQVQSKMSEEKEAQEEAVKLNYRIRRISQQSGTLIDPHKAGKFWQQMALGLLKGTLQAVDEVRIDNARKELYEAEARMREARQERNALEAELDRAKRLA